MSWLVVFASAVLPIALLFILVAIDWLQRQPRSTPSPLRVRRHDRTANGYDKRNQPITGKHVTRRGPDETERKAV